ncbi:hypothetical protein NW759_015525 [Fusarium solani]|nr:hypothetical protein NW759_015525 [Fusarium solani]
MLLNVFSFYSLGLWASVSALTITETSQSDLASDLEGGVIINGASFQEDVLVTYGHYQYTTFYNNTPAGYGNHYVNLGRRQVVPSAGDWEIITFTDYIQRRVDGHNMISLGISGDGRIHLSFDQHNVPLRYRVSVDPIAEDIPSAPEWTEALFGPVLNSLPGSSGPWTPMTYPRFQTLENGDMLFEFRIGGSGNGDSYIHRYSSSTEQWRPYGRYLQGNDNNAYINGLDYLDGRLYTSWIIRETPNANTNHDLFFAYSDDEGQSWHSSDGTDLPVPISTDDDTPLIWNIPQNSQLVNQEG